MPSDNSRSNNSRNWHRIVVNTDAAQSNAAPSSSAQSRRRIHPAGLLTPAQKMASLSPEERAKVEDVFSSGEEFIDRIIAAKNGPFTSNDRCWRVVCHMWNRLEALHIDPDFYLHLHLPKWMYTDLSFLPIAGMMPKSAQQSSHPSGLTFPVHEFLKMCAEVDVVLFTKAGDPLWRSNSQSPHSPNNRVNLNRFLNALSATRDFGNNERTYYGPMTHSQAAVFVTSLEQMERLREDDED
ncbi:hypothetical protein EK21DRAFT_114711 [Setomelanomma holmii]|uniref:Uncharacterized protein n=1 Tax=Setomelanomma holmii TaxID=210430 RepID=A0A9P4H3N1_9PLEO|nr:hypothetical protein EK21DRAFT_114711 [Setomelanomma holmii]